jgi:integrase
VELVQPIREEKQIEAMKKILKAGNLRDYCMFVLGINCGLRIGDLLSLTVSDVLDEKGKVKGRIVVREQKTSKAKNFPIGDTSKKALNEYLKTRKDLAPDQALFPSRKGGGRAISRVQAYRILNKAARAVGIQDEIGTHTLRKTFGYWAYRQCKDITLIQKLLNHSAPSVTLSYIGVTQDDKDNIYLSLNL